MRAAAEREIVGRSRTTQILDTMATFSSPEFEKGLKAAFAALSKDIDVEISAIDTSLASISTDLPDIVIGEDTQLRICLPRSDTAELPARDFVELATEVTAKETTFDGLIYHSPKRAVFLLQARDTRTHLFLEGIEGEGSHLTVSIPDADGGGSVGLTTESLHFSMSIVQRDYYWDKYLPPHGHGSVFVSLEHNGRLQRDAALDVANAYLMELASTLGLLFFISEWPSDGEPFPDVDEVTALHARAGRLRPLMTGKGMGPVLREFNRGIISEDPETALICYVKCIEHVSATVVRERQYEDLRKRLQSPGALNPTAAYMDELMALCEENRLFLKDHAALRLTVERCCDAVMLAAASPECIRSLSALTKGGKPAQKKVALSELAACLSATRNQLAHSKANYELTGKECPAKQLRKLATCAQLAAEQCMRWYAGVNPDLRRS